MEDSTTQTTTQDDLTSIIPNDILSPEQFTEVDEMSARYYFNDTIYLYGVFEESNAYSIIQNKKVNTPINLYETPYSAKEAVKNSNFNTPVLVRFAVHINPKGIYYDELTPETKQMIKNSKLTKTEFIKQSTYTRVFDPKTKLITYQINNSNIIINAFIN